jgi:peptidyl-prolyl cis-trans isomerase A (cyclophilin A)
LLAVGLLAAVYMLYKTAFTLASTANADAATASADASATPETTPAQDAAAPAVEASAPEPALVADAGAAPTSDAPGAVVLNGDPVEPAHREPTSPDPRGGRFTLENATEGLAGTGNLVAEIETSMGTFSCQLLAREAPNTVANFVGLARGRRDFWDPVAGVWTRRPFYDGSIFHRVIPDFMIQGGDILRSGTGGTGYEFGDENVTGHNAPGLLCMANHDPGTNGAQFFITETANPQLDGSYSIFGRCTPTDLVRRIARVERNGNRPVTPVFIQHVRVRRG